MGAAKSYLALTELLSFLLAGVFHLMLVTVAWGCHPFLSSFLPAFVVNLALLVTLEKQNTRSSYITIGWLGMGDVNQISSISG